MRRVVFAILGVILIINLPGCATISRHQFVSPAREWQTRSGQLLYRNARTTLIGEVLVRFSKSGDFELTFSKGPGVTLLVIRQDASFAEVKGALARIGWSGAVDHAPAQLRGWLGLREKLIHALAATNSSGGGQHRQSVRFASGAETFLFHF